MRMRIRKFRNTPSGTFSPEVTSVTGNDRDHGYRRDGRVCACQPEVVQYPPSGAFSRKLATGSDVIFPRIFLSGSTKCWLGVFYTTSASSPFPGYLPLLFS